MRRVVVTGMGMINSLGLNKDTSFKSIIEGKCGIKKITSFDASNMPVRIAGEINDFDPSSVMDSREIKKADRFIQLALQSSKEAMEDSGLLDESNLNFDEFGISSGSGIGGLGNIEKNSISCFEKGPKRVNPFFIPSSLINMLSGFISIEYNLKGPNIASVTACAAGTHAIIDAYKTIVSGGATRMLAVGAESAICPVGVGGFASMKALSTRNDDPLTASRPFDKERDGFVMGEGAATLVLESYDLAVSRNANIYAEIIGYGESGDANHITAPSPNGEGAFRAMKRALTIANTKIDYINAHGTSTYYNDLYESIAIKNIFGDRGCIPPVSSTKGQIGHCLGAAGAIEAVISILSIKHSILPPTINQITRDPECNLDYIPNTARDAKVSCVMSNSFGFGGTNGVLIFRKV